MSTHVGPRGNAEPVMGQQDSGGVCLPTEAPWCGHVNSEPAEGHEEPVVTVTFLEVLTLLMAWWVE